MKITEWIDEKVQNLNWCDITLTKFSVMFATLFLVTVWPTFRAFVLSFEWYWYLALMVLFAAPVIKKMFSD